MITIEKLQKKDLPKVAELFEAYREFYRMPPSPNQALRFLSKRFKNKESVVFLAKKGDQVIGFTQLYPLFSSTQMARIWLLNDLYVLPEYRNQNGGKRLLEQAKKHAEATQAKGVILETEKTNEIGNALYPKMGFMLDKEHHFYEWQNPTFSSS